jgi:uncharacterized repeat protein (TIGR01451 family)
MKTGKILWTILLLLGISMAASQSLPTMACAAEDTAATGSFGGTCDGTYPGACGAGGDLLACNDGFSETHIFSGSASGFAGVNSTQFNSSVTDCLSVSSVSLCYEWWVNGGTPTGCYISVDNDGGASPANATVSCPGASANPGITCVNVTGLDDWQCSNFFGPSGTRAIATAELRRTGGGPANTASWDALFFNVTYAVPTPVSTCSVIGSPGKYVQSANLSGAPNPTTSVSGNACVRINASNVLYDCNGFRITNNGTGGSTFGIILNGPGISNVTIQNCPGISQYTHGLYVHQSANSMITNVTSYNNSILSFTAVGSNNITFTNDTAGDTASGIDLSGTTNSTISGNNVFGTSGAGISLSSNSSGNIVAGNNASDISSAGFELNNASANSVSNNLASNASTGFLLDFGSSGNLLTQNNATGGAYGFAFVDVSGNGMAGNIISGSSTAGISITDSNQTALAGDRTFNNTADLSVANVLLATPITISLSGVIFDNPAGTFSNFTNLSINDSLDPSTGYLINWSPQPAALPGGHSSFAGRFVNITNITSGVSIDRLVWNWLDSEPGATNESLFQLWEFDSGGWASRNATPDTAANTLALSNESTFSVFAILASSDTSPPNVTLNSPADGSVINDTDNVTFNFTAVDDLSSALNCSLSIDGLPNSTNAAVANGTPTLFNVSGMSLGNHTWKVACTDAFNNTGNSSTWSLFIAAVGSCPVITEPGSYVQVADLLGAPNTVSPPSQAGFSSVCVKIAASDTVYDCNGFDITNNGVNNAMGIYINGSISNVTLMNCGISEYKRGITVFQSAEVLLLNNTVFNNTQDGIFADTSSNLTLVGNNASFNKQNGIAISGGGNNTIVNNTISNNSQSGMDLLSSPSNNFTGNTAEGNAVDGLHVASSDFNLFSGNILLDNKQDGIQVVTNTNNTFIDNLANNNTQHGLHIVGTTTNLFINNTMDYNSQDGMLSASSTGSSFINNTACYNGQNGFLFASSTVDVMIGNTACSNSQSGIFIDNSNLTTLSANHYFNNTLDFTMTSGTSKVVNTTSEIFDNPFDSFQNYTNISMNDTESGSTFSISWSPPPAFLPAGCPVFADKFVNITNSSGSVSVDSITWFWLANETAGLDPDLFRLAVYNGTGWTALDNQTPDLPSNSITVKDLDQFGIIGIFMCNDSISALKLDQTVAPPSAGGLVQFNITLNNTGNTTLNPVRVVDALPAGLTFSSASPVQSNLSGQVITWNNVGPLAVGSAVVLFVNATVDPGLVNSTVPMVALTNTVNATGTDPINLNLTANSSANVTIYYANLTLIKLDVTPITPVSPGGFVVWNVSVSNPGEVPLDIVLTDTLPAGFQYAGSSVVPLSVSPDNRTITWIDTASPGASGGVLITSVVDGNATNGTYCNDAIITGEPPNGDNVSANDTSCVGIFAPAINLVKTVNQSANVSLNANVTYTLNITNTGAVNLTVSVADTLPANVTFRGSGTPPTSNSSGVVTWENLTVLPPGGSILLSYNVSANSSGSFLNNANATGVPPNGNNVSDSDSATFTTGLPPLPPGDHDNHDQSMQLTYDFLCPNNVVAFNSTDSGDPLSGVSIKVIYDTPPSYFTAGTLISDSEGLSTISLSSNGTYDLYVTRSGYNTISTSLGFTTCPAAGCQTDSECPSSSQCIENSCQPVQCQCAPIVDHACGAPYECCSDSDCPAGQSCGAGHACEKSFECLTDGDCKDTQYCDIPAGSAGGDCRDVTGCGLVANHTISIPYQCGLPSCPACPQNQVCEGFICLTYNLTGPDHAFVGDNVTLQATRGNESCGKCAVVITLPDNRTMYLDTDDSGRLVLPMAFEGHYNATLTEGGVNKSLYIQALARQQTPEEAKPTLVETCLPWLLLLLILIVAAYLYWRRRKKKPAKK